MPFAAPLFLFVPLLSAAPVLEYKPGAFAAEIRQTDRRDRLEYEIQFPSVLTSPFAANNTVWGHLSLPSGPGPFPCILVLPVMAAPNIWIERRFIKRFERDGFAVLWLEMPYQFHRRAHPTLPSGQGFLSRTASRLAFNFRQSALDARRALDWLSRHPKVDRRRIGLFGISLGALVGSAVYSVDATPQYAVFLLGGADFPDLVGRSAMTGPFIRRAGIKPEELRSEWRGLDPLEYQQNNRAKPALLVNASWDRVIPAANALKLKEAFPGSRQFWVPLGHYSSLLHLVWIPRYISRDFLSVFRSIKVKNP
ncbi:MAG: hypothetical protein A3J74_04575 [Elusimicrobia bacterium RIFCSPHIGHO2_02_FULL_57_9]|nr:MAG: hypothetical protein A3J74_04575 [Elusimicrobia bacterium RIFCSPHIGHO2_02_FULL_57_9]